MDVCSKRRQNARPERAKLRFVRPPAPAAAAMATHVTIRPKPQPLTHHVPRVRGRATVVSNETKIHAPPSEPPPPSPPPDATVYSPDGQTFLSVAEAMAEARAQHKQQIQLPNSPRRVVYNLEPEAGRQRGKPGKLALCIVGAIRTLLQPPLIELFRKNIIEASRVSRTDVFLALSETDRTSLLLAQQELHPVWTLANVLDAKSAQRYQGALGRGGDWGYICRNAPPVMQKACQEVHGLRSVDDVNKAHYAVAHGRLQFWWIARCLQAVVSYEELGAIQYDHVVRVRPDVTYLSPLPPFHTLDPYLVHHTLKASTNSDVLFVIPAPMKLKFLHAAQRAYKPGSGIALWPEEPFAARVIKANNNRSGEAFDLRSLDINTAIRRPCALECIFPVDKLHTGSFPTHPFPLELRPYEKQCHAAAAKGGVFGITHRVLKAINDASLTIRDICFNWSSPGGYRSQCCADAFRHACMKLPENERKRIGWPKDCLEGKEPPALVPDTSSSEEPSRDITDAEREAKLLKRCGAGGAGCRPGLANEKDESPEAMHSRLDVVEQRMKTLESEMMHPGSSSNGDGDGATTHDTTEEPIIANVPRPRSFWRTSSSPVMRQSDQPKEHNKPAANHGTGKPTLQLAATQLAAAQFPAFTPKQESERGEWTVIG